MNRDFKTPEASKLPGISFAPVEVRSRPACPGKSNSAGVIFGHKVCVCMRLCHIVSTLYAKHQLITNAL